MAIRYMVRENGGWLRWRVQLVSFQVCLNIPCLRVRENYTLEKECFSLQSMGCTNHKFPILLCNMEC